MGLEGRDLMGKEKKGNQGTGCDGKGGMDGRDGWRGMG